MKQRQPVTAVTVQRYRNGRKKIKQQIMNEFCETTGYAVEVLNGLLDQVESMSLASLQEVRRLRRLLHALLLCRVMRDYVPWLYRLN